MKAIKWQNVHAGYVAFLDILGYKQIVKNNSHERLKQIYSYNIGSIGLHVDIPYEFFPQDTHPSLKEEWKTKIRSQVVSDSIIVWTTDDSPEFFIELIYAIDFMMAQSMLHEIPLRGGVSTGEISWHADERNTQTIVTGAAIVEAYELSEIQNWAGCTITEECITKYRTNIGDKAKPSGIHLGWEEIISNKILVEYQVPMKNGRVKTYWVPNWTLHGLWSGYFGRKDIPSRSMEKVIRRAFSAHNKEADDWLVEAKIRNTLMFLEKGLGHDIKDENWPPEVVTAPTD